MKPTKTHLCILQLLASGAKIEAMPSGKTARLATRKRVDIVFCRTLRAMAKAGWLTPVEYKITPAGRAAAKLRRAKQ